MKNKLIKKINSYYEILVQKELQEINNEYKKIITWVEMLDDRIEEYTKLDMKTLKKYIHYYKFSNKKRVRNKYRNKLVSILGEKFVNKL